MTLGLPEQTENVTSMCTACRIIYSFEERPLLEINDLL